MRFDGRGWYLEAAASAVELESEPFRGLAGVTAQLFGSQTGFIFLLMRSSRETPTLDCLAAPVPAPGMVHSPLTGFIFRFLRSWPVWILSDGIFGGSGLHPHSAILDD
ncbi:hypothetical protein [Acidithiobacillus ferruginosus]|uniref:Uncharacterized protein n=1 Tax=Acidithiobacillus ferruginosus TaxID=3063951 RepID=A0ACD5IHE0_9PROT|nr:hypothetical protein [Acidithiobacillus ferruginosus]MBU2815607.1 hypothetical protein [Acidithiobacillus ferruginosus]